MRQITYTNKRGESVVFGDVAPYILRKIDGTGGAPANLQTQKAPFQDGVTHLGTLLEPRAITLEVMLLAEGAEAMQGLRSRLARVMNSKVGPGVLRCRYGGHEREIEAIPDLAPVWAQAGDFEDTMQPGLISVLCPSPFWLDIAKESSEIVTWIGGMTFPWRLPSKFAQKGPSIVNIINRGDVETPVRIEFKGPATNPKITKRDTGEYMQVIRELVPGDVLIVTTDFGAKRVEINGQNAFNYIDLGSTFWQLDVGDNVIEYSSDDPVEPAAVSIAYRNRYVGV